MSMPLPATHFDINHPLQPGVMVVEASAGTGKTWSIASLVLRLIAEGRARIDRILVMTFTVAATGELRERIRARLAEAEAHWGQPGDDIVLQAVQQLPESTSVRYRIQSALRDFDTAAIYTIHSFCQRMLRLYAFDTGLDFAAELLTDARQISQDIAQDYLAQRLYAVSEEELAWLQGPCALHPRLLADVAALLLRRPDIAAPQPSPPAVGSAGVVQGWKAAAGTFAQAWQANDQGLLAALRADAGLKPGKGKRLGGSPAQVDKYAAKMQAWLESDRAPHQEFGTLPWVRYFSSYHAALAKLKDAPAPFDHPLMQAWDVLLQALPAAAAYNQPILEFAAYFREELPRRLGAGGHLTFADLLQVLHRRIVDADTGPALSAALRGRYDAALIDEFQDTDPLQWQILEHVFAPAGTAPTTHLLLIGDPKQAIYRFRGADIETYAEARVRPQTRVRTMQVNQRSDGRYVQAVNALWAGQPDAFAHAAIAYQPVDAAARNLADRLLFPSGGAMEPRSPVQIRWVGPAGEAPVPLRKADAWGLAHEATAQEVQALLASGAQITEHKGDKLVSRPLRPSDIAVLVRKNAQTVIVRKALRQLGIPAIISQSGNVWQSQAAQILTLWLTALSQADRETPVRLLALTPLIGWDVPTLAQALEAVADQDAQTEQDPLVSEVEAAQAWVKLSDLPVAQRWNRLRQMVQKWAQTLQKYDFLSAWQGALAEPALDLYARLGQRADAERLVTDLRHVTELVQAQVMREHLQAPGLLRFVTDQQQPDATGQEAALQRLESDADAVQITTIHKSKGLEYPVVIVPYAWDGNVQLSDSAFVYHGDAPPHEAGLALGPGVDAARLAQKALALQEELQESVRLLYVATTRARHHMVLLWGPIKEAAASPLAALIHGVDAGQALESRAKLAIDLLTRKDDVASRWWQLLQQAVAARLADAPQLPGPPLISLRMATEPSTGPRAAPELSLPLSPIEPLVFTRETLADAWKRLSYTALTQRATARDRAEVLSRARLPRTDDGVQGDDGLQGDDRVQGDDGVQGDDDVQGDDLPQLIPDATLTAQVPLAGFARGTAAGTLVHELLESVDFTTTLAKAPGGLALQPKALRTLTTVATELAKRQSAVPLAQIPLLVQGIELALRTPLGRTHGLADRSLAQVPCADRLDEWPFDLPLPSAAPASLGEAHPLAQALVGRDDPVFPSGYREIVLGLDFGAVAGYLTGAVDLVLRMPRLDASGGETGDSLWYIVDYKTNLLGPKHLGRVIASRPMDYNQQAMREEMAQHHYFLQYHLYLVVLHRYLQLRLGQTYDYDRHIGGAIYLFVRGLCGPDTPTEGPSRHGVFCHKPAREVIEALSQLFARGAP